MRRLCEALVLVTRERTNVPMSALGGAGARQFSCSEQVSLAGHGAQGPASCQRWALGGLGARELPAPRHEAVPGSASAQLR